MKKTFPPISGNKFILHVCNQLGLDPFTVRRVVIDAPCNAVASVYVEHNGDDRLLGVEIPSGVQIKGAEND